jgi:hypothetical protein
VTDEKRLSAAEVNARLKAQGISAHLCGADPLGIPEASVREIEQFAESLKAKARASSTRGRLT